MHNTFYDDLKDNLREGILLLVKYGLFIVIIIYSFLLLQDTRAKAENGEQAAIFLGELQKKGYLPSIKDGQIPEKTSEQKKQ